MKLRLAAIALLLIGYCLGGRVLGILDFFNGLVWTNPLGEAFHDAVLVFDDDVIIDFYAAIRMDFRLGIVSVLAGFVCAICAMILPRKLDILPWFFAVGVVARIWVPLTVELIGFIPKKVSAAELLAKFSPDFAWDLALVPACMLGTAMGRLVRLRRVPRWRIRSIGVLTALLALWLAAGVQSPRALPFATCGLLGLLSIWLLIQTNLTAGQSPNHAVNPSGGSGPS
jgi:hypothetical protein